MNINNDFEYNNEEEAEMAQLHSIHLHMNAVAKVRDKLAKQAEQPSAEECTDCGEPIPEARRTLIPGVQLCTDCQSFNEKYRNFGKINP
jgi:phage/conjugal plasmid C-4 type zinc finger TraR family protein